jgi:hypothetical protein
MYLRAELAALQHDGVEEAQREQNGLELHLLRARLERVLQTRTR